MLFMFFFALSMYFAARAIFNKGSRNELLAAYALMALATLTKGLIGAVLPALILISFVAVRRDWRLWLEEPSRLFFILWFLAVFLFFTMADTKREIYLLPLFPPMALFIANYIDDLVNCALPQGRLYRGLALVCFNLLWIGCLAVPIAAWFVRPDAVAAILPYALAMACGSLFIVYFAWQRSPWRVFLSATLRMLLGVQTVFIWLLPFLDRF